MFDLSYFNGRRCFHDDGSQNYLVFQTISKNFRMPTDDLETIIAWKTKELSDESMKPSTEPGNNLSPKLEWICNSKIAVEFKGNCLKQVKALFTHKNVVNLFTTVN